MLGTRQNQNGHHPCRKGASTHSAIHETTQIKCKMLNCSCVEQFPFLSKQSHPQSRTPPPHRPSKCSPSVKCYEVLVGFYQLTSYMGFRNVRLCRRAFPGNQNSWGSFITLTLNMSFSWPLPEGPGPTCRLLHSVPGLLHRSALFQPLVS